MRALLTALRRRAARACHVALARDVELGALERARRYARAQPLADPLLGRLAVVERYRIELRCSTTCTRLKLRRAMQREPHSPMSSNGSPLPCR
eukprot:6612615-Prymnesium_polylepis.1